jgi:chromate transport protein ChrA
MMTNEDTFLLQRRASKLSLNNSAHAHFPQLPFKAPRSLRERLNENTREYLPLAFITFGGPPAHIALLHERFVRQKRWLSEAMFAELLAISSALPGPASTQLAYTVALIRDGVLPAIWAFCLWSVPGGLFMGLLGALVGSSNAASLPDGMLYMQNGLAAVAVALVALAAYNLGCNLCTNNITKAIAVASAALTINFTTVPWVIPACMVVGGLISYSTHVHKQW